MGYNSAADIWVYLHLFSRCCLPKSRNHAKIQSHRSWCQWKAHMWIPISH